MASNPFTVLGFGKGAFQGLSDRDIRSLVNAQYRALASIHHPDSGGNIKKFKNIQQAYNQLEEKFEFDYWKKTFMRKRKDQVAELEEEIRQAATETEKLQEKLVSFWLAYCRGQNLFKHPYGLEDFMGLGGFSVFNPPPLTVIVMDRAKHNMIKQAAKERYKAGVRVKIFDEPDDCFSYCLSSEGITKQKLVQTYFDAREKWRPQVRKELIELRTSPPTRSYYWKPEGKPEAIEGIFIGSFPKEVLKNQGREIPVAGFFPAITEDYEALRKGWSVDEFSPFLRFVYPYVIKDYLAIIATGKKELRFKVLGSVKKILK